MAKKQSSDPSSPPPHEQPLDSSQVGDLSDPQMLDRMLNQLFAQLPKLPNSPEAIAGTKTQMLEQQNSSRSIPGIQAQSSGQNSKQQSVQLQQSQNGQDVEQQTYNTVSQLSSPQSLEPAINPILSKAQQLVSGLQSQDPFGAEAQQFNPLIPHPETRTGQLTPDVQGKPPTSVPSPSIPASPNGLPDSSLIHQGSAAGLPHESGTPTPATANSIATPPDSAATQASQQGHQTLNSSVGGVNDMTGMGDFNPDEFLPDPDELQRLFEQQIAAKLFNAVEDQVDQTLPSEATQQSAATERPAAAPLPTENTPNFYFLPDSQAAQSASPAIPEHQQISSLPRDNFDVEAVRQDFPILHQQVRGKPLIWMDNAATSQKPQSVIDTLSQFYEQDNSNVHRGAHALAARSTNAYEEARQKIQRFLGASLAEEIVFVRGTTEGINLVAQTYGRKSVKAGDEIVLTTLEHHSNIVPWQMLAQEKGAVLKVAPISDSGEILLDDYEKLLSDRTCIVALSHVSNVLGTVLPIKTMAAIAHRYGAKVVVDGAQSVPHFPTNVQDLDADFFVFSGHKLFGPTGIGALYGKAALLEEMPPWQGGGNMIESVSFEKTTFNTIPAKFEAGTGNLAAAVGLGAAIDYLNQLGFEAAAQHEEALMTYATAAMAAIPGLRQIGTAAGKVSTLSFTLKNISSETMGKFLDSEGIAVRAGHHCAQPTMKRFGVSSTVRPSLAFYNTFAEVDTLIQAIEKAQHQLS